MHNIAVVGGFASGKTTLSQGLVDRGYTRLSFAKYLKEIVSRIYNDGNPIDKAQTFEVTSLEGVRREITGRRLLQEFGQSVKAMDRDFWIRAMLLDMQYGEHSGGPFITDDCRFPYEADALRDNGFIIVKLEVPLVERLERYNRTYGTWPTSNEITHPSEMEVENIIWDYCIDGEKSPQEVIDRVYQIGMEA
jgi:hypothetical protein